MLSNKSILITGGTGSLGRALTAHIFRYYPDVKRVVIFSRDEKKSIRNSPSVCSYFPIFEPSDGFQNNMFHYSFVR
jgi:NAD dependent epimerase/dehydratase family enzyme